MVDAQSVARLRHALNLDASVTDQQVLERASDVLELLPSDNRPSTSRSAITPASPAASADGKKPSPTKVRLGSALIYNSFL